MSNYAQNVFFGPKDTLTSGDAAKIIKGTEIDAELSLISTAIASKENSSNRGVADGYAPLNSSAIVANTYLPTTATRWPTWSEVTSKPATFPPETHTHTQYVELAGGTMTGFLGLDLGARVSLAGSSGNNTSRELLYIFDDRTDRRAGIGTYRGAASTRIGLSFWGSYDADPIERVRIDDSGNLRVLGGDLYISGTMQSGTVPWARLSGVPSYLPLSGGTLTGTLTSRTVYVQSGYGIELGAASDTTISRLAAAKVGVEGKALLKHAGAYTSGEVTVSTSAPTGGSNGDVWYKVDA